MRRETRVCQSSAGRMRITAFFTRVRRPGTSAKFVFKTGRVKWYFVQL